MNKKTIIGFLIILISIQFFTSKFYYEKILRKPYPIVNKVEKEKKEAKEQKKKQSIRDSNKEKISLDTNEQEVLVNNKIHTDTITTDTLNIDTFVVESDKIICSISEKGGNIISIKTKEYTYNTKEKNGKYIELVSNSFIGGLNLSINNKDYDNELFNCSNKKYTKVTEKNESISLNFVFNNPLTNLTITKTFTFFQGSYKIGYRIISNQLDGKSIITGWKAGITESEYKKGDKMHLDPKIIHLFDGKNVEHITEKKRKSIERTGYYNWVGITSKYFLIAIIPDSIRDADIKINSYEEKTITDDNKDKRVNYAFEYKRFASGKEESYSIYSGPSKLTEIKKYKIGLQKVLFKGYAWFFGADKWFPYVCEFVLWLLIKLQKLVKDYGIVIILLTIILKIVTYPLTLSSMKSMNKMKEIQPRINKIREKYKGNTQKMNQKIMEFYKNEGVNPLGGAGGCLPMLLQMPIMISLYIVLRKAIELRGQETFLVPWVEDLSQPETLFSLGFTIPMYGSHVALLPILMAILMYFQNKMTIKDPNQKAMIYMMPAIMLVMFNNLPSGLSLYFTFSTALQVLQQILMDKKKKTNS